MDLGNGFTAETTDLGTSVGPAGAPFGISASPIASPDAGSDSFSQLIEKHSTLVYTFAGTLLALALLSSLGGRRR